MGIGTSLGAFYDDEFHYQQSQYDPSRFDTNDQNVISPNKVQQDKALDNAELDPSTGMGLEIKDKMPFPDNNNPDTDFANRFPKDMKSGILNDLKPVINPGGPAMVRKIADKISESGNSSFKGGYLGVRPHVENDPNDFWFKDDWQNTWDSAVGSSHYKGDPKGYVDKLGPDWEGFSMPDSELLWLRKRAKQPEKLEDLVS